MTLLEAYNMKYSFDIICFSLTYLHSSIQHDIKRLHLNGCKLARAENPTNIKRGGVGNWRFKWDWMTWMDALFLKLAFRIIETIYFHYIDQLVKYIINLVIFYLNLSKSYVILLLEINYLLSYPLSIIVTGDLNARAGNWWRNGMITTEDAKIGSLLLPMALVRLFLTKLIFFQILLSTLTLFL